MVSTALLDQLGRSRDLGFLGDGPLEQHVEHSSVLLGAIAELSQSTGSDRLLDLGSGGGVPGLVAVADGRWSHVALLDRSERRSAFLRSAVSVDGLAVGVTTEVLVGSAEVLGHRLDLRERYDAVVSRSFGPPSATLECASAFVAVGGVVAVSDPPGGRRWPSVVPELGLELELGREGSPAFSLFRKVSALLPMYPRREGVPNKRPLFVVAGP